MSERLQLLVNRYFEKHGEPFVPCQSGRCPDCVGNCNDCLHGQYFDGGRQIRYDCPNVKRVYVNKFLASHADPARLVFRAALHLLPVTPELSVACFGTGPGTDALALMDVLADDPRPTKITFSGCDMEESWGPVATELVQDFQELGGAQIDFRFVAPVNVVSVSPRAWEGCKDVADIAVLSWILSEVEAHSAARVQEEARRKVLDAVTNCASKMVVVMDRPKDSLRTFISGYFASNPTVKQPAVHEELSGLNGIWFTREMKDRFIPDHKRNVACWIAEKK